MTFNQRMLGAALGEIGVRETSRNSGPRVDEYLSSVGLGPGYAWCAAFVHWCAAQARPAGGDNPCPRTAGALKLWDMVPPRCIDVSPESGRVFVLDHGHGLGHVGIVEEVVGDGTIVTVEGNTNGEGSREGDRVARHRWAPALGGRGTLRGYIDLGRLIDGPPG